MTQSKSMVLKSVVLALASLATLAAQIPADEPVVVFTEHPRLFLRPARLRLLRRERERNSERWRQFQQWLPDGVAPTGADGPEPGFASALYYQVAGDATAGRRAILWAIASGRDLRQLAIVYDWGHDLLTAPQQRELAARIQKLVADTAADDSLSAVRSRVLGAIALYDDIPQTPQRELERVVRSWWLGRTAPSIASGRSIARDDAYPLWETMHALRDNTNLDLRESAPEFFREFPIEHLIGNYPAPYPGNENDFYIGLMHTPADPDPRLAVLSRAAELAMVAYDTNAEASQMLQGWLTQERDRFLMRSGFGIPYEFLWANPYQPGLSYYHLAPVYHDPRSGHLFARSGWEDSARWFGWFDGVAQLFADGHITVLNPQLTQPPLSLSGALILFAHATHKFEVKREDEGAVFAVGLEPKRTYTVEIDDEEMFEATADAGGTLDLSDIPRGRAVGVRLQ